MPNPKKLRNKKKQKKTKKGMKIIPMPAAETASENEEENEDEGGMFLDKESIQIIYNALSIYKPTEREEHLHGVLLDEFKELPPIFAGQISTYFKGLGTDQANSTPSVI
jgi:hypothetical protein